MTQERDTIIIGAGPAGLTAAYELVRQTNRKPLVLEADTVVGGISRTVNYKGNRIDIGGHRFFSKSQRVMDWWQTIMPVQGAPARDDKELKRELPGNLNPTGPDPEQDDDVLLLRRRLSRIYYRGRFFDYPISLSLDTLRNLGPRAVGKIGWTYLSARARPVRPEKSLEDFLVNRFGRELYATFFKDYTKKVWGVDCRDIPPEWGAQRIKGVSIASALSHAVRRMLKKTGGTVSQQAVETSLIEQFLYPKYGPGQLWEKTARLVEQSGGDILMEHTVTGLDVKADGRFTVRARTPSGTERFWTCDQLFSSMPLRSLAQALKPQPPGPVVDIAAGLPYRDFITVGLLLRTMKLKNKSPYRTLNGLVPDNWIYIQEPDVKIGRLQVFNNWSPYMVADPETVWLGLEYFCNEGDALWASTDADMAELALGEMEHMDMIDRKEVMDCTVIRIPKAYPAYFGTYRDIDHLRHYLNGIPNLFPIGRNGMHRYNNQDHSMLTAMESVQMVRDGRTNEKARVWDVNAEAEYHEHKGAR
ncbi:MAG: NAD(P)/FAD-dependent oxidoreductase [Candidatus Pacebacteria bacterium]|nr:NAD(P)/FAD-dependent oxidoreductase [Candidatus Paceibacterota bacterium]